MTTNHASILKTPLNESQRACVDLLKEALAEALEGNVSSCAIVVCMKSGYASVMAGSQAADLYMGCGSLQRKILCAVEDDGNVPALKKSSIMRVGGAA